MFIVYKATHLPTGKIYVGQTKQKLEVRIGQHWSAYRNMAKFNIFLQQTKMDEWKWEILHTVNSSKEARDCELYYINTWGLYETGLNSPTGPFCTAKGKKEASDRLKKYRHENPEPWNKGKKGIYSEQTLERMRLAKLKNPTKLVYTEDQKIQKSLAAANRKQITELGTGLIFQSIAAAAKHFKIRRESVRDVVNGRRSHTGGLVFALI